MNKIDNLMMLLKPSLKEKLNDNYSFRPKNFQEYIGQVNAKEQLFKFIKGAKERNRIFPHVLIHGEAGSGKTSLARIIANELGVKFVECIASDLENIADVKNRLRLVNGGVFFQDEIHSLSRTLCENMHPLMEFKCNGTVIKPFTLIGATSEIGELIENRKPFYDRFKLIIELDEYSEIDLITIGKQYKNNVFPEDQLNDEIFMVLASNCRNNPRSLIRLLDATIYFEGNILGVLNSFKIIKCGYTKKDLKVLEYITLNESGVGLNGLANFLGTSASNYLYEIEPFLLRNGLIVRTPKGRRITNVGIEVLEDLKSVSG